MYLEQTTLTMALPLTTDLVKRCECECSSCKFVGGGGNASSSESWLRSVKRKHDEVEEGGRFFVPGLDDFFNARVQIENECAVLREMVSKQQQTIEDLYVELEEERNAASTAANEAMSMILRLQREKAEIEMEARQFKRFAEEKMAHDQEEAFALEDLLYKREQTIQALTCEVQAYKHRMLSYGFTESEVEGEKSGRFSRNPSMNDVVDSPQMEIPIFEYPPLKCTLNEHPGPLEGEEDIVEFEKYAFGETPHGRGHLRNLEQRIYQLERSPRGDQLDYDLSGSKNVLEKVIVGYSPRRRLSRMFSMDSSSSFLTSRETCPDFARESPRFRINSSFRKGDFTSLPEEPSNLRRRNSASEHADDSSDRVYTVDSVYNGVAEPKLGVHDDFLSTPRDSLSQPDMRDPDIKKLYLRLQALEADKESLRQAIISMRTDKAQMVLLKEIAQHLYKEMTPERRVPTRGLRVSRISPFRSVLKLVTSFVCWKKKARRSKYLHGLSPSNVGLLMLLDRSPRQWRCLSRTQV